MKQIEVRGFVQEKSMLEMLEERSASVRATPLGPGEEEAPCFAVDFPIHGGWGYSQEDACVIEIKDIPLDMEEDFRRSYVDHRTIQYEKLFFERRVYEEIIFHRLPETPNLECLHWKMKRQALVWSKDRTRVFDRLDFRVEGFLHDDLVMLKADAYDCELRDDHEGLLRNAKMADERLHFYESSCWFDITSVFHGRNLRRKSPTLLF